MKIEYNNIKKFTRFKELKNGEVFLNLKDNFIYMKIENIYCYDGDEEPYNTINLSNGESYYCVEDAKVYVIDATFYVKE